MPNEQDVIVIGAGAAGLMAAGIAAQNGAKVLLLEKNDKVGRKIGITGKGRCNVTNNTDMQGVLQNIPTNQKFLYSALRAFLPQDTMAFFEENGVPLKTERGNRVFPVSDRAQDIVSALRRFNLQAGVKIVTDTVTSLDIEDGRIRAVNTAQKRYPCRCAIVATGGASYPATGSTGDGYRFAKESGHTVTAIRPSLVPLEIAGRDCKDMMGLSLKNVSLSLSDTETQKEIFFEQGELLFTHFGLSGPLVLSASAHLRKTPLSRYEICIDLKPALDEKTLDLRLQRELCDQANRNYGNVLASLLPQKMIGVFVRRSGIPSDRKANSITKEERKKIGALLKHMTFSVRDFRPISEAIVTSGGVDVGQINPKTMESKLVKGLYFAGEVLDLDAYTGGFNLQIAFSCGVAAGKAASAAIKNEE